MRLTPPARERTLSLLLFAVMASGALAQSPVAVPPRSDAPPVKVSEQQQISSWDAVHNLLTHTSGIGYGFAVGSLYQEAGISDGLVQTRGTIAEGVRRIFAPLGMKDTSFFLPPSRGADWLPCTNQTEKEAFVPPPTAQNDEP